MCLKKIGIFGGAFNPVHFGHINLAKSVMDQVELDKLLLIPTKISPHKNVDLLPYYHRESLLNIAFKGFSNVEISDIEQHFDGTSYTINTILELKKLYTECDFYLIMGGDMLLYFRKWYRYSDILSECKIIAAARHEREYQKLKEFANELGGSRVKVLKISVIDISSTKIREIIENNGDISQFMPSECADYIKNNNLFVESNNR